MQRSMADIHRATTKERYWGQSKRGCGKRRKICTVVTLILFFLIVLFPYHPFQNHYTHEIFIFELFKGLQLQLSGVLLIN